MLRAQSGASGIRRGGEVAVSLSLWSVGHLAFLTACPGTQVTTGALANHQAAFHCRAFSHQTAVPAHSPWPITRWLSLPFSSWPITRLRSAVIAPCGQSPGSTAVQSPGSSLPCPPALLRQWPSWTRELLHGGRCWSFLGQSLAASPLWPSLPFPGKKREAGEVTCYSQVLRCKNIMGCHPGFSLLTEGAWISKLLHLRACSEPRALEWASGGLGQGQDSGDSEESRGLHTAGSEQQSDWASHLGMCLRGSQMAPHLFPSPSPSAP